MNYKCFLQDLMLAGMQVEKDAWEGADADTGVGGQSVGHAA